MVLLVFALWFIILYAIEKQTKPKGKCKNLQFLLQFRLSKWTNWCKSGLREHRRRKEEATSIHLFIFSNTVYLTEYLCLSLGCDGYVA